MRDAHVDVIAHHDEVVRRRAGPADHDPVVDLGVVDRPAGGNAFFERVDIALEEGADALLELADVGRDLGNDHRRRRLLTGWSGPGAGSVR